MPVSETIIVAEDSRPNRNILVQLLKKVGYQVLEAPDGKTALFLIKELEKRPDCILTAVLTDVMMPGLDGLSLLREIRNDSNYQNLPCLFITAVADRETIAHAKDLQVNGYLLKPITLCGVIKKLQEIFPSKIFAPPEILRTRPVPQTLNLTLKYDE